MTSRSAFTVMELLLVITLMAVLTSVITVDFGSLMRRSKINSSAARMEAAVQQAHLSVQSGLSLEGTPLCSGLFIGADVLSEVQFPWDSTHAQCDTTQPLGEPPSLLQDPVRVSGLSIETLSQDAVFLLFEPPLGTRRVLDALGQPVDGVVDFSLVYPDTELRYDIQL